MPSSNANLVTRSLAILAKDIRLELRSRHALNAILLFAVSTLSVVSFSVGQSGLGPHVLAALYWVVIFFSAIAGLSHSFVREEETGTGLLLRLKADPDPVYLGKFFFNLMLLMFIAAVVTPLFFAFTDATLEQPAPFLTITCLGILGLCASTTIVAAIIARAASRGALFAVLSFPLLIPVLLVLVRASQKVLDGQSWGEIASEIQFLVAFPVVMIVGSILLFKFVWRE